MTDPVEAKGKLREIATELDACSKYLGRVTRELRPVQREYEAFIREFRAGLWQQHKDSEAKLPSSEMQLTLALQAMPAEFLGKHYELTDQRGNLKQRISDLKAECDAWRSILSADRTELEAIAS